MTIQLRDIILDDLPIFFEQHRDPDALWMAAFTPPDPADRETMFAHWQKIIENPQIFKQTIVFEGQVAGHLLNFEMFGQSTIGYWLGKNFWGKGIATQALTLFLAHISTRPLYARVVKDNVGSIRVLEKNGFVRMGEDSGFSHSRNTDVEEWIMELGAATSEPG